MSAHGVPILVRKALIVDKTSGYSEQSWHVLQLCISVQRERGVVPLLQPRQPGRPRPHHHHHPQRSSQVWDSRAQQVTSNLHSHSVVYKRCFKGSKSILNIVNQIEH